MSESNLNDEPIEQPEPEAPEAETPATEDPEIVLHSDEEGFDSDCTGFVCSGGNISQL